MQRSCTTVSPAARARAAASSLTIPSWSQSTLAPTPDGPFRHRRDVLRTPEDVHDLHRGRDGLQVGDGGDA